MPDRVLVTGASGFIGGALCRALCAAGARVRALHRRDSRLEALEGLDLERAVGDILAPASLEAALAGVAEVYHTAAQPAYWRRPAEVVPAAVAGTVNVVRAARAAGVRRLVLTSSLAAMGLPRCGELLTEDHVYDLPPRHFPYAFAKRRAEVEALREAGAALEVVVVNPSVVLGAGDRHQISGSLVVESARGRAFLYVDGGVNIVHLDDVVEGHLAAMQRGRPGARYLLAGENVTHGELFAALAEITGRRPPWLRLPGWVIPPAAAAVDMLGRIARLPLDGAQLRWSRQRLFCDPGPARAALGLGPPRPFRQAAAEAYEWYRAQGML